MARRFVSIPACGCVAFVTVAAAQQLLIADVRVEGTLRYPASAIVTASELSVGRTIEDKDISAAVRRLSNTGMFSSVAWRYDPKTVDGKPGIAITLQIEEAPLAMPVTLNVRDVGEKDLWQEMKSESPLILGDQIPASQEATQYYVAAVKAALHKLNRDQELVERNKVDFFTHKFGVNIETANLPAITGIKFEGNRKINSETLTAALRQATFFGESYTDAYARKLLEAILIPLYEERGYYKVKFPKAGAAPAGQGVTISASVEEGQVWTLGNVDFTGDGLPLDALTKAAKFPEGKLANWKAIDTAIQDANAVLRHEGYVTSATESTRTYHDDTHVLDVALKIIKGEQYRFGSLELSGLAAGDLSKARSMWQLVEGAPLDGLYVDDYLRALGKQFRGIKSFSRQMRPRTGSNVMDVVVKITLQQP